MLDVGAFVVFGESMIDAVDAAAVSANVGDEFFRPADGAAFHERRVSICWCPLKIVPARGSTS